MTTTANELLRPVHERMPVILPPDDYSSRRDEQGNADCLGRNGMDLFDILGVLSVWIRSDPKKSGAVADALWSPLALLGLFTFAVLTVGYYLASTHR